MDRTSLLCESCGYGLEGLPVSGKCPECGKPIAESLPSNRTGTAWQRRPGLFSWALTCKRVLVGPEREFSRVSMSRGTPGLLIVNLLIAGTIFAAPWTGVFVGDPVRSAHGKGAFV